MRISDFTLADKRAAAQKAKLNLQEYYESKRARRREAISGLAVSDDGDGGDLDGSVPLVVVSPPEPVPNPQNLDDEEEDIVMTDYDVGDGVDGENANAESRTIKIEFDRKDVKGWFQRLEIRLEYAGVQSQWLKRLCLENILPQDVAHCCKDYFSLSKTEASANGALVYKNCKTQIIKVFGPNPEEDYLKALKIVMAGPPSQAAKDMRDLMCQKKQKLQGCCCATAVAAKWKQILPTQVRASIAHMDMATDFENVLKNADLVYNATKNNIQVAAVTDSAPKKQKAKTAAKQDPDTSADAPAFDQINQLTQELAAFNKNFKKSKGGGQNQNPGRGAQQKRGGGQWRGANQQGRGGAGRPQGRGPHPDGPPDNASLYHWRFGKSAWYCLAPT